MNSARGAELKKKKKKNATDANVIQTEPKSSKFQHHCINRISKFWILAVGNTFAKCYAFFFIGFEWKVHMNYICNCKVLHFFFFFFLSLELEF